jgi:FMN phosphatase YigB (HAD superfamily)
MTPYHAVLFDLFSTVALFDREKLPEFTWNGSTSRSTMGGLRKVIEEKVGTVPFARFYTAMSEVSAELAQIRTHNMREISSVERFTLALTRAGLNDGHETRILAEELSTVHMGVLAEATIIPSSHLALLERVRTHYQVALVSNFDHAPTAWNIIERGGAGQYFQQVVISDEHGWRKPHPKIFTDTLAAMAIQPHEALFVGDSPHDDVVGAKGVGMDVAWVNAQNIELPEAVPAPEYVVRAIPELNSILFAEHGAQHTNRSGR